MEQPHLPLPRTRRGLMSTALPAIAVMAVVGALLAWEHRNGSVEDRRAEVQSLAMDAARSTARFVNDQFATLAAAASAPTVADGRLDGIRRYLPLVASTGGFTGGVTYLDADLEAQASSQGLPPSGSTSFGDRAYARQALDERRPVLSDVLIGRLDPVPVVAFAQPVYGDGPPSGVLVGAIRLDQVDAALRLLLSTPGGSGTLLDRDDRVVVADGPVLGLEAPPDDFDLARMRREEVGVRDEVDTDQGRRLVGFSVVPGIPWLVIAERPYEDVIGPLDTALAAEVLALLLLAALGLLLTLRAGRRLDAIGAERDAALDEQRTIALRLQRSLLPDLAGSDAVDVVARYAPAHGAMAVGGDWYDLVHLEDGRVALSVGDVAGHGLTAAAAMGQLRSAGRTLALAGREPAEALEALDRFAAGLDGRPLATVVYLVLEPQTGELRYACAGHPPPLVVRADGGAAYLEDGRSPLLGVPPSVPRRTGSDRLGPGDTLVCYTDGLIELPGSTIDEGLDSLRAHAAEAAAGGPEALAEALLAGVAEPRRDDTAVLCLRLAAQPSRVAS